MRHLKSMSLLAVITLGTAAPAFANPTHYYTKNLEVTPAMMAAIETIVAEKHRIDMRRRHHT